MIPLYEWEDMSATSYKWANWVWENNQFKFKILSKLKIILEEFIEYALF